MSKSAWIAIVVALLAIGGYLLFVSQRNSALERGFAAVAQGMSSDAVVSLMGKPSSETSVCHEGLTWEEQPIPSTSCAKEFRYDAHLKPVYWTMSFDGEKRAIAKYEYVSP